MKYKAKPSPETLARLRASRERWGVTLAVIAAEAAKTSRRGTVGIPTVSKVLSGASPSDNVIATTRRLIKERIAAAKARQATPEPERETAGVA